MKGVVRTHRDLVVWQKAMDFVVAVYGVTDEFPVKEQYGLCGQLRKAAVSIPSNIAEGFGRKSPMDFIRFLQIATGSLFETQTQLELACRLGYIPDAGFTEIYGFSREIDRILSRFIRSIRTRNQTAHGPTTATAFQ